MRCTPERFWVFPGLIDSAYSYLLGLYLGDGCLASHRRGVFRLEIALDGVYPRVIAECEAAMSLVMPSNRVRVKPRAGDGARLHCDRRGRFMRAFPVLLDGSDLDRQYQANAERILLQSV